MRFCRERVHSYWPLSIPCPSDIFRGGQFRAGERGGKRCWKTDSCNVISQSRPRIRKVQQVDKQVPGSAPYFLWNLHSPFNGEPPPRPSGERARPRSEVFNRCRDIPAGKEIRRNTLVKTFTALSGSVHRSRHN